MYLDMVLLGWSIDKVAVMSSMDGWMGKCTLALCRRDIKSCIWL